MTGLPTIILFVFLPACNPADHQSSAQLAQRIDQLIEQNHVGPIADQTTDAEFVRRVYLDLMGMVPLDQDTERFLADRSPNKREVLIDKLLATPQHARRLANVLDLTLMERRADKFVPRAAWEQYLFNACRENKPYDALVREILTGDGADPNRRPLAKFYLERDADPNLMVRDIARTFFGRDLQCAQCHDHPRVADYTQKEFFGLQSMVTRTVLSTDAKNVVTLGEKVDAEPNFQSVFFPKVVQTASPHLPGHMTIAEPVVEPGSEYVVKPADKVRSVAKVSRRELLAKTMTQGNNRYFNRNIVNRLWAMMMGRGLVHPLDWHHADNPPIHPAVLDLLAEEFVKMKYNMREMIGVLARTKTYQRSFDAPANMYDQALVWSNKVAEFKSAESTLKKAQTEAEKAYTAARKASKNMLEKTFPAENQLATARWTLFSTQSKLVETKQDIQAKTAAIQARQQASPKLASALESAKSALATLPADAEIKALVDKLTQRKGAIDAESAELTKQKSAAEATGKTQEAAIADLQKKLPGLQSAVTEAHKQCAPLLAAEQSAKQRLDQIKQDLAIASNKLLRAKACAEFVDAYAGMSKQPVLADLKQKFKQRDEEATLLQQVRAQTEASLASSAPIVKTEHERLTAGRTRIDQELKTLSELEQSLTKAKSAVAQLANQSLSSSVTQMNSQLALVAEQRARLTKERESLDLEQANLTGPIDRMQKTLAELSTKQKSIDTERASLRTQLVKEQQQNQAMLAVKQAETKLLDAMAESHGLAILKPLTPEQLVWSVMQATYVVKAHEDGAESVLEKKAPMTPAQKADPAVLAKRAVEVEADVYTKLQGQAGVFIQLFGNGAGQPQTDFFATADQALFLLNGGLIQAWTSPGSIFLSRTVPNPAKVDPPEVIARKLYLAIYSRPPKPEELTEFSNYMAKRSKAPQLAVTELAWAMLTSPEFRFNH